MTARYPLPPGEDPDADRPRRQLFRNIFLKFQSKKLPCSVVIPNEGRRVTDKSQWIVEALDLYEAQLVRYATWVLQDAEIAKDVVQETFLRLCREEPSKIGGHLAQWLFTVCRNLAFDIRKKEARMTPIGDIEIADTAKSDCAEVPGEIFRLLDSLPKNQREVVYLKVQGD